MFFHNDVVSNGSYYTCERNNDVLNLTVFNKFCGNKKNTHGH